MTGRRTPASPQRIGSVALVVNFSPLPERCALNLHVPERCRDSDAQEVQFSATRLSSRAPCTRRTTYTRSSPTR